MQSETLSIRDSEIQAEIDKAKVRLEGIAAELDAADQELTAAAAGATLDAAAISKIKKKQCALLEEADLLTRRAGALESKRQIALKTEAAERLIELQAIGAQQAQASADLAAHFDATLNDLSRIIADHHEAQQRVSDAREESRYLADLYELTAPASDVAPRGLDAYALERLAQSIRNRSAPISPWTRKRQALHDERNRGLPPPTGPVVTYGAGNWSNEEAARRAIAKHADENSRLVPGNTSFTTYPPYPVRSQSDA